MKLTLRTARVLALTFVSPWAAAALTAQNSSPAAKGPTVYSPNLAARPDMPGWKTAFLQGATGPEGQRFVIPNLDVMQPVLVMLVARDAGDELTLKLFKDDFTKAFREGSTKDGAVARFRVRTQGDLRIIVSSSTGGIDVYQLAVMVGDEVKIPVPSLYVPLSYAGRTGTGATAAEPPNASRPVSAPAPPSDNSGSGGAPVVMWIIAGCLVFISALLAVLVLRKRSAQKTVVLVLALGLCGLAPRQMQGQEPSTPSQISIESLKQEAAALIEELLKQNEKAAKTLALFEALAPADEGYWPDYTPPGIPGIPTACVAAIPQGVAKAINETTWSGPCSACYAEAHEEIATVLQRFEKLRRVHARTLEVHETAMTFGSGVAATSMILTAEWMKIRKGIKERMEAYNVTYDDKVVELTADLEAALQQVAACELKYFNNPSWYERYGFMFVNPVAERHRR